MPQTTTQTMTSTVSQAGQQSVTDPAALPTYRTMLLDISDGVATVTLNRPDRLNAMNHQFFTDLKAVFEWLADQPAVRVAILKGAGKHFTAGLDLKENSGFLMQGEDDPARVRERLHRHVRWLQSTMTVLEDCPFPVIAALHGACIGGGVDLSCAADIRLATADCYFCIQEIEVGIVADLGTLQRLPKLIPPGIVNELSYTGRHYGVAEAEKHGFVNHVLADRDALYDEATRMAREIAAKSPLTVTGIKRTLLNARDHSVHDGLEFVAGWNSGMLMGQDLMKAMQATLTKTTAQFEDRMKAVGDD